MALIDGMALTDGMLLAEGMALTGHDMILSDGFVLRWNDTH